MRTVMGATDRSEREEIKIDICYCVSSFISCIGVEQRIPNQRGRLTYKETEQIKMKASMKNETSVTGEVTDMCDSKRRGKLTA